MRRQICNKVRHSGGVRHPVVDGVTIKEVNNKQDWESVYINSILENILITSNNSNVSA